MFSALLGDITIPAWEVDITARHDQTFTCPDCLEPVVARCGETMPWHFAHKADSTCGRAGSRESAAHAWAKYTLGKTMADAGYSVAVEEQLGEMRRPDLTVVSPTTGRWCTVEIQASAITATEMRWRWAYDHDAGATDTLWVWVGAPAGLGEARNLHVGEDLRYYLQTSRCSLSVIHHTKPYLANPTTNYWMCRPCVLWTTAPTCRECGAARPHEYHEDRMAFDLVEATAIPVVCQGPKGPVVRFGAATAATVVDNIAEPL